MGKVINISNYERKKDWKPFILTLYSPEPGEYALNIGLGWDDDEPEEIDLKQSELRNIRDAVGKEMLKYERYNKACKNG